MVSYVPQVREKQTVRICLYVYVWPWVAPPTIVSAIAAVWSHVIYHCTVSYWRVEWANLMCSARNTLYFCLDTRTSMRGDYTRVCGRIKGYQYGWPDGFELDICSWYCWGSPDLLGMISVLVMLLLILPSHHLWVETISVNQDTTQTAL